MSARPLRVLHVLGELRASGAEVMLVAAAPTFAELGVSIDVLSTGEEQIGRFAERLREAGYGVHHVPFARSLAFFWRLFRLVRSGYDAVHVHTERATFWVGLTLLAARMPVMVKSNHSSFEFTGSLRLRRMVQRHLLDWLGLRQVAVGRSVQEVEKRHFGLDVPVVENWVDVERFHPPSPEQRAASRRALSLAEGEVALAVVGNCHPVKNHGELLRALARVPAARRPLLLHAGEEEAGQPERALARSLEIEGRVRFLGSVGDVRALLHAADGFVACSIREGFSISALEALATGLPLILSDVQGLKDLRPIFPGLLYAAPEAEALSAALLDFLNRTPEARAGAAATYPEIARTRYGVRTGVEAYVKLYRGG